MSAILDAWEKTREASDRRWLANELAQTFLETGRKMVPVEEIGKGAGHAYGVPDPVTGCTYYGRGLIQITHAANYQLADEKLGLVGSSSLYLHPDNALEMPTAIAVMFRGMEEGWFRRGHTLRRYLNQTVDDPYNAREIINGDKDRRPEWANGWTIGDLIRSYHQSFLAALVDAAPTINETVIYVRVRGTGEFTVTVDKE